MSFPGTPLLGHWECPSPGSHHPIYCSLACRQRPNIKTTDLPQIRNVPSLATVIVTEHTLVVVYRLSGLPFLIMVSHRESLHGWANDVW